jgi:N-methylhydantoinase A
VSATATAIVRVALANMFGELSGFLDQRGLDARDFTLVAFGGAGPLIGCLLAEELNVRRVLVPIQPGTLCALGALKAEVMTDVVRTLNARLDELDGPALAAAFVEPVARAEAWLALEAPSFARSELNTSAEMRYVGQAYEIEVPVDAETLEAEGLHRLEAAFHALHEQLYFHADTGAPAEIVDLRVRAIGYLPRPPAQPRPRPVEGAPTPVARREIVLSTSTPTAAVYDREQLVPGHVFEGPAVVEQTDTTTLVPPGWRGAVDPDGNLVVTVGS